MTHTGVPMGPSRLSRFLGRSWFQLRVEELSDGRLFTAFGGLITPYVLAWILLIYVVGSLAARAISEPRQAISFALLVVLAAAVASVAALTFALLLSFGRVAVHVEGWTRLSALRDRGEDAARLWLVSKGFESALRCEALPTFSALRDRIATEPLRAWSLVRHRLWRFRWTTVVEAHFEHVVEIAFASSTGTTAGSASRLDSESQDGLVSRLRELASSKGTAHLGVVDGRLRVAVHDIAFTRAKLDEMALAAIDFRDLLGAGTSAGESYRSTAGPESVEERDMALRAFVTDREQTSPYKRFASETADWAAQDGMKSQSRESKG